MQATTELFSVATPGQVDWKYLDRDKQSIRSIIFSFSFLLMVASEDISKQVSTYGERYGCLQGSYLSFIARAMTLLPSMSQATIQLALSSSENQNCFPVLNSTSIFSSSLKIGSLGAFIVNKKLLIPLPRQGTYYSDIASED
ncbi:hypothetical protein ES288_A06G084800v1 [Gossypium darwinii]|uniref:Uncharacterized protein n=1 Tax=Gossypium darwinii TaxID=34276 RepID=A0A5D2G3B5_GOSDA|nr:hypothetical protein ES288_A06G084800v1 [Gossypium darwinii]